MKSTAPITIIIADDHPMFRKGLRETIEQTTPFTIVGEAPDGGEALRLIEALRPSIAVLDVKMPRMTGLEVAQRINDIDIPVAVIILTMYEEYALFNKAIDAGVKGYILKESAVHDILDGITKVAGGEYYFSPSLTGFLMKRTVVTDKHRHAASDIETLTSMERQVLRLIAESLSSREIARRLSVSVRTVESHRYNISRKLHLNGGYALLRYALANVGAL